ncbi:MAG TPA: universal stress protein [Thermodesulfobacteriota bacterium]|nr:universal stress protein [Thermodesulfobacteriota bacterium]
MIPQIKKILYATDLSKNSAYAFYYAIDLAQRRDAKIVILHVIESLPPIVRFYGALEEEKKYYQYEQAADLELIKKRLEEICQRVEKKGTLCLMLVSNILVRVGHPVEEILRAADEEQCDVLILGSHGKGFLQQTFLGSVSHKVLDRSRRPVFIIPLPSGEMKIDLDEIA